MEKIEVKVGATFIRYNEFGREVERGKVWELTPGNPTTAELPGMLIHWHAADVAYWYANLAVAARVESETWGYIPAPEYGLLIGPLHDVAEGVEQGRYWRMRARRIGRNYYRFVWHYNPGRPAERGVQVYRIGRPGDVECVHSLGVGIRRA